MKEAHVIARPSGHILWHLWRRFYPLAMSDFVMTLGDMIRPIALSHLPHATMSLAAIGVIKSIAVFFESPIIMILHASTALSNHKASHQALWRFTIMLSGILTSIFLIFCYQPLYDWLFLKLFSVSPEIASLAKLSFVLMTPWPALIAIRRFYQGVLIRQRHEKYIAIAGTLRLLFTIGILWLGARQEIEGTLVAALSLIGAVAIEAIAILFFYYRYSFIHTMHEEEKKNHYTSIVAVSRYYMPLGSTSMAIWSSRALLIGIIARASDGILSIAVWTTAMGFILPVANATRMVQQLVISSDYLQKNNLLQFTTIIGLGCSLVLCAFGFTESGAAFLSLLLGDNHPIALASLPVMQICLFLPLLTALQNAYQGFLILCNDHWWINVATLINLGVTILLTTVLIAYQLPGEISAALGMVAGLIIEVCMLIARNKLCPS